MKLKQTIDIIKMSFAMVRLYRARFYRWYQELISMMICTALKAWLHNKLAAQNSRQKPGADPF